MERIHEPGSLLKHVPIPIYASVMGTSGLGLTWRAFAQTSPGLSWLGEGLLVAGGLLFTGASAIYISKTVLHPDQVKDDLLHPVKHGFAGQFPISLLLLAEASLPHAPVLAQFFAGTGTLMAAVLLATSWTRWTRTPFLLEHITPIWTIPAISSMMVPLLGVHLGWKELSWFFFSAGVLQWLVLLPLVLQRTLTTPPAPTPFQPLQAILMAPPAVGFLAHVTLTGQVGTLDRVLYFASVLFALWTLPGMVQVLKSPFNWSWWAYTMPLAAVLLATHTYVQSTGAWLLEWGFMAGTVLLSALVFLLLVHSVAGLLKGTLFRPE